MSACRGGKQERSHGREEVLKGDVIKTFMIRK